MTDPVCSPQDLKLLNNLAIRLYRELLPTGSTGKKHDGNLVFSPTTLLLSLQQVDLASQGNSQEELRNLPAGKEDIVADAETDVVVIEGLNNRFARETTDGRRQQETIRALPGTIEDFHNLDGRTMKVLTVHLQGKIFLSRDEKLKVTIAELPLSQYDNNFLIVLPDDSRRQGLKDFEEAFKEDTFDILRQDWQMPLTHVYLPKFSLENHFSLAKPLQDLGVKDIFSPAMADLSAACRGHTKSLHVADMLHAASIDISCETGKRILPPEEPRAGECSGALEADTHPEMWNVMGRVVHLDEEVDRTVWSHHKR
ncbi:hypothetical protein BV898_14846 [Hypsibius exemplaris]|uniref:Serpin domain-containing protein n=1 Tax=Hypsibius exemplaris TaxID=2072580 RepID=A0A9X6N9E4_HYPEX|nr:hypothetical protein BV898_14846 [Hypsibius exemplaris]